MRLVMFHPADHPLERGWVGRIDGEHVTQLAAQTLQSFFTGGGAAREHAMYRLADVRLLAPVLHPPSVRLYSDQDTFEWANPAAICSPNDIVRAPSYNLSLGPLALFARLAGVVGAHEEVAGLTLLAEWRRPGLRPPKDRDFALGLGPVVVTPDELGSDDLEAIVRVDGEEQLRATLRPLRLGSSARPRRCRDAPPSRRPARRAAAAGCRGPARLRGRDRRSPAIGVLAQSVEPEVEL